MRLKNRPHCSGHAQIGSVVAPRLVVAEFNPVLKLLRRQTIHQEIGMDFP
jgi:hypothetical protein